MSRHKKLRKRMTRLADELEAWSRDDAESFGFLTGDGRKMMSGIHAGYAAAASLIRAELERRG